MFFWRHRLLGLALLLFILLLQPSATINAANPLDVVIQEIAWMGTTTSTYDEWIVLTNTTNNEIDITGWTLNAADGSPTITLDGAIPANGSFLLERTDDNSAPTTLADQIYTGSLGNTGENLTLSAGTNSIDNVDTWYAGDNNTKETMYRTNPNISGTNSNAWTNGAVDGSPQNSLTDNDNDGYLYSPNIATPTPDCDDTDDAIYPGATEILNQKDDNCDGQIDEGLDSGPAAISVYFNDTLTASGYSYTPDAMEQALVDLINNATTSIDAALYGLDREYVRDALINAHNRGVAVRIVGDDDAYLGYYGAHYAALENAGIPVVHDNRASTIEHNKFFIFDSQTVWTGSTNITNSGFSYNSNNSIAITSAALATAYTQEFEEMFTNNLFSIYKTDNTTHNFLFDGTYVESYFSPSDNVEQAVYEELSEATDEIYFALFYFTSDSLGDLLVSKHQAGVTVDGIFDAVGASNLYAEDNKLCAAGMTPRIENFGGKVHHKFAVIDPFGADPVVITGSYNWTSAGTDANDENTLIIHDAAIAQAYYNEYLRMYNSMDASAECATYSAEANPYACYDGKDNDFDGYIDSNDFDCNGVAPP
ncbi:MAG TPA: phospholipase D-like domain-containing protein, partial [Anaerolineae bacterium]|nr:phospholipase D-like domain-containing protein [Anaerolineae bacterium]